MASTLIFLCVLLGGPLVLPLLGPDFSRGATALAVLAAGGLIKGCFGNAGFVLVVGGRQTVETANAVFGAVANVLLNLLWIPSWGLLGAAVATTTVAVIMATLRAVEVDRLIGLSIDLPSLARPILLGVACGAMGLLAAESLRRVGVGGWAGALLPAVAMVIGYPALLWRFGLEAGEKRTIGNWIRRRFANAPVA